MELPQDVAQGLELLQENRPVNVDKFLEGVTAFVDFFRSGTPHEQQLVREKLQPQYLGRLVGYASRVASRAVRTSSLDDVERGLAAAALEGGREDYRSTLTALSLLHRSAEKLGANPNNLFVRAAVLGGEAGRQFILNYAANGEKRIESMGFKEGIDENGFTYVADMP